ncbi:DHA2 family efflux MFS transporter permease subunit [Conexibacter woesei]|uniref:Drug resistance transporter, EmrB/QacA subfamily n=1 Tax=Conexibacter woesei (strain DSM 14684 / CCUG 47730 / CIP 108061 / JCM 11494 / NBRC 100937 / ID131577) TaxID=469383 RepID=D3F8F2_CONWI|nr:DHA2 family efflux MFS transporter permease subunit [Conexibacter woesei]ADB49022.1 drug resistance transporter, EmrB/QacA subfamily [Conexibacter woesei DSM 14684]
MTAARWVTLAVVSAATAMLLLDVTIVYVALPAIQQDLGASFASMQWVIDAYTVALAATLLGAGALADRLGRRVVFAAGLAVFTIFSALCGLAGSALVLDLARGAQGIGAAAMFAASLAILAHEFRGAERGFALGVWGAITGAALAVGPLLGGLVVDGLSWRWIFLVNVPLGIVLVIATLRALPESREPRPGRLDVAGMVLFGAATFLAVLGLIRGNEDGWGSAPIVAALVGAGLLFVAFVAVERRAEAPMLPLALFRIPAFSGTALIAFAQSVAIYPLLLFLAIYLQNALGYTPTEAGLRLLPMTLLILAVAPISGKLTGRLTLRVPLVGGLVLFGIALFAMRGIAPEDEWTRLLPGLLIGGVAVGMISPALAAAMVAVLPVERSGLSSGINNTFRQLGIAIGIAGLGAIFDHHADVGTAAGITHGLHAVGLVAAIVAVVAAAVAWPLLGRQRSTPAATTAAAERPAAG